jgi:serine/threonine-protein kinase
MLQLRTLGAIDLWSTDAKDLHPVLAQPKRLALLVYLALATPRGPQRRDRLVALFWPEQDIEHARNALNQAVFFLRRVLGADTILSRTGDEIALAPDARWCDALAFEEAVTSGRYAEAVELYRGDLLVGLHVPDAAAHLDQWLEDLRSRYARSFADALEALAGDHERASDYLGATIWWRRLAARDPYSSRVALRLMRSLVGAGDRAGALQHARIYDTLVRNELDMQPDSEVAALCREIQSGPLVVRLPPADRIEIPPTPSGRVNPQPSNGRVATRRTWRVPRVAGVVVVLLTVIGVVARSASHAKDYDSLTKGLYTRGELALLSRTPASLRDAIDFFRQAIAHDSTFAAGYAGIAEAYGLASDLGYLPQAAANDSVKVYVRRAFRFDSTLSEVHAQLAGSLSEAGEFVGAEREFKRAVELDPKNGFAHHWYAMFLATLGRGQEAIDENALAQKLSPLSASIRNAGTVIRGFFGAPQLPEGAPAAIDPTHAWARANAATRDARNGDCPRALQEIDQAKKDVPNNVRMTFVEASVTDSCVGRRQALALLNTAKKLPEAHVHGYYIAMGFHRFGQIDSMFVWLDSTGWNVEQRFHFRMNKAFDSLQADPRYQRVLRRMGLW